MQTAFRTILPGRGVLAVAGDDRRDFLQGLVSNDMIRVDKGRAVYAALLTAQGRFLHDFFVLDAGDALLVDCEAERRDDLRTRLTRYRLRAKVAIEDRTDMLAVGVLTGDAAARLQLGPATGVATGFGGGHAFVDPRLAALGVRAVLPRDTAEASLAETGLPLGTPDDYDRLRLGLGVPDGSRDMPPEKALLLESNFDELNGVDWKKGCYIGQELTARTKYRGLLKRRLMPVSFRGDAPPPGTQVVLDGKDAGETRSSRDGTGLALLRIEAAEAALRGNGVLMAGDLPLAVSRPAWLAPAETVSPAPSAG
ncbi:MAG: YgfZ/GcvT domain-containing protein [Alphaproteobacteria bacterium]